MCLWLFSLCIIQIDIEMNTTFEKSANSTDEWYTPKEIIDALGEFDLDPCAPVAPPIKRQMSCTTKMTMD